MKVLLIANPMVGGRRGARRTWRLVRSLERRGHAVELFHTRKRGDAEQRAREVEPDLDRLVVAGGDGTLNEVWNGLEDPSRIPIAQLPLGTANLLARELGLPFDPEGVVDLVENGRVAPFDLATANGRRFALVASCGFDAMVTRRLADRRQGRLGYRGYLRPIFATLRHYREPRLEVVVDEAPALDAALVVVGNIANYGGIFRITERARPDSGVLDVCALRRADPPRLMLHVLRALRGGLSGAPGVDHRCGRHVSIRSPEPVPYQIDGDFAGTTPVEIRVLPSAARVLRPAVDA